MAQMEISILMLVYQAVTVVVGLVVVLDPMEGKTPAVVAGDQTALVALV
jgi:hypothetical protein